MPPALQGSGLGLEGLPEGDEQPEKRSIDAAKAERELGLHYTPIAQTIVDMARSLLEHGIATPTSASA